MLIPQLVVKGGTVYAYASTTPLIAPAIVQYQLNAELFNTRVVPQLGLVNINEIELDCGNGTRLPLNIRSAFFE